jgi:hypothetical protein
VIQSKSSIRRQPPTQVIQLPHSSATKIDICGAYLNAEMTGETVIMEMDRLLSGIACKYMPELEPYVENGKILVKLDKALYGCIQSARLWHDKLTGVLEQLGFSRNPVDPCVLTKGHGVNRTILTVFIDDILVLSKDDKENDRIKKELRARLDDVKAETSNDFSYLGMHIQLKRKKCIISWKASRRT